MFYTYELVDPRDQSVFYVGKGKGDRLFAHERDARCGKRGEKCERIRSILGDGEKPVARIVERFANEQAAYDAEAALIAKHGAENLTNVMMGGFGGRVKRNPQKEARKLVRECKDIIRRAIVAFDAGISVTWNGLDFVKVGYDIAMGTRERAGAEYFDEMVWAGHSKNFQEIK